MLFKLYRLLSDLSIDVKKMSSKKTFYTQNVVDFTFVSSVCRILSCRVEDIMEYVKEVQE